MPEGDQWWLIVDGVAVGYLHTALHDRAEYPFTLCDIEVREGHRRQGYARRLLRAVQDLVGETIHTTGSFTPLGAAALENRLPVLPGEEPGVKFADMTFVRDWDNLIPHSPL